MRHGNVELLFTKMYVFNTGTIYGIMNFNSYAMMNKWKEGSNYFRIVEVTKSGTHLYSTSKDNKANPDNKIDLYPNPTRDRVSLRFHKKAESFTVNVYDASGAKMETLESCDKDQLTFGDTYELGIYLVEVVSTIDTQMFRFVKE